MRFMNMHTRGAPLSPSPSLSHTRLGERSVSPACAFVFTLGPLLLDSGRFYLTSGDQGDTIDMRVTPATSGRLGINGLAMKNYKSTEAFQYLHSGKVVRVLLHKEAGVANQARTREVHLADSTSNCSLEDSRLILGLVRR
ncbi:hypothetical protein SRHO_G00083300 [Serrasalmus rhombeus]